MDKEAEKAEADYRPSGLGPGERLQAARIKLGLTIEDVASRMHLSAAILESIEDNSFDEITAPIFVKGYLRSYARIVSLNEDELIRQYQKYYSGEDPPIGSTSQVTPELSVADVRIKWTTYLVILILAALLAAWWWNQKQSESMPISLGGDGDLQTSGMVENMTGSSGASPENGMTEPAPLPEIAAHPVGETTSDPADEQPLAADAAGMENTATAAAEAQSVAVTPQPVTEVEAPAAAQPAEPEPAEPRPEPVPAAVSEPAPVRPSAGSVPADSDSPVLIAPAGSDRLEITVIADTWADIKDGSDYQMVYDLLRANQTVELIGSSPFTVFLGNGHGVEIRYNDEVVEFSGRIRADNTTRLKIGG